MSDDEPLPTDCYGVTYYETLYVLCICIMDKIVFGSSNCKCIYS